MTLRTLSQMRDELETGPSPITRVVDRASRPPAPSGAGHLEGRTNRMNQTAEQITETAETIKDLAMAALEGAAAHLHRTPLDSDLRAHVTRRIAASTPSTGPRAQSAPCKRDGTPPPCVRPLATAETYASTCRAIAQARLTARDVLEEVQQMDAGAPAVMRHIHADPRRPVPGARGHLASRLPGPKGPGWERRPGLDRASQPPAPSGAGKPPRKKDGRGHEKDRQSA